MRLFDRSFWRKDPQTDACSVFVIKYAVFLLLLNQIASLFLLPLIGIEFHSNLDMDDSLLYMIFLMVLVGPFFETLVFQAGIIHILNKGKLKKFSILISALCFGFVHYSQGLNMAIVTFFGGLLLAVAYVEWLAVSIFSAVKVVFLIHATINALTISIAYLLD